MKKINILLLSFFIVLTSSLFADSASDQELSVSLGCLTTNGDLSSDYQSGMSFDFFVTSDYKCPLTGMDLGMGFGFAPMSNDEDDVAQLTLGSASLYFSPRFNVPLDFNFGLGLAEAPGEMGLGMTGLISMNLFYELPFCCNTSIGLQYKQFVDPEDGELNFAKLGAFGIALKIDG